MAMKIGGNYISEGDYNPRELEENLKKEFSEKKDKFDHIYAIADLTNQYGKEVVYNVLGMLR